MADVSEEFVNCWNAAGLHIQNQAQGDLQSWLRANLNPPFLEHLSFRLGNQLFFIQIEDVDNILEIPGSRKGLLTIANGCRSTPGTGQASGRAVKRGDIATGGAAKNGAIPQAAD